MPLSHRSPMTINRHIIEMERQHPDATGDFSSLLFDIALAAKIVSREVNKAGLVDILGITGETNVQGEEVQKLDEYAQRVFYDALDHTGHLCIMASEERSKEIPIPDKFPTGHYSFAFDPLDGSSNIDVNVSIGTIFSIHRKISKHPRGTVEDLLQQGSKQVAAGYVIYGSSTMLVYSAGKGVYGFTLDPSIGEFFLSHNDIKTPKKGKLFSVNVGNIKKWKPEVRDYIEYLTQIDPITNRPYSLRYIGSLVADFHRNLLKGGIFMYPVDAKTNKGKLRLLYEASPLSFIAEQAGGYGSDGEQSILDIQPTELHQRVPLYLGSYDDVKMVEEFLAGKHKSQQKASKE